MARSILPAVLVTLILVVPCFSASPTFDFERAQLVPLGGETDGIAAADFNGDGSLDLAVISCCPYKATLSILLGDGNRGFKRLHSYSLSSGPTVIVAADFNNDGRPDLVVGEGGQLEIFLNAGDATFHSASAYKLYGVTSIAVGDLNGDHKLDLAIATSNSNIVTVMLGNGDGTFASSTNYAAGNGADAVAMGDFNQDGNVDLVVSNGYYEGQTQNQFSLLLGNGNGSFQSPVSFQTDEIPVAIAAADFNGDGMTDVAVLCSFAGVPVPPDSDVVDVFLGKGNGNFQAKNSYHTDLESIGMVVVDLNHDGAPDIAVLNSFVGSVTVLLNRQDGTFDRPGASYQTYLAPSSVATTAIAAGDFGSKGDTDVVTATGNGVSLLHSYGRGFFRAASDYPSGVGAVDIGVGDFNGDGLLDLVTLHTAASGFPGRLVVLPGKAGGGFVGYHSIETLLYQDVRQLAVGDLNDDGKLDIVVGDSNIGHPGVTVVLGNGDGTFTRKHSYDISDRCFLGPIALGDLNGDGYLDLVVANSGCQTVTIFLGRGDGTFRNIGAVSTGGKVGEHYQQGLVIADLNNDGKLDIAVTNGRDTDPSNIGILLGKGDGTFHPVRTIDDGNADPYGIVAADFNGDGNLDLAITNYQIPQVMVLLGRGDGSFKNPKYTDVSQPSRTLLAGDFDGDGKIDLAASPEFDYEAFEVAVLHGKGDGSFEAEQDYPAGQNSTALTAGKFQPTSRGLDLATIVGSQYDPHGASVTVYEHRHIP